MVQALPHLPLQVEALPEQALQPHHEVRQQLPGVVHRLVYKLDQAVPAASLRSQVSSHL